MPNYPYISGQAGLIATFAKLRSGFPAKVDAGYLQRFNIARSNESYVISILRFLGLIDEEANPVEGKTNYFYADDGAFKSGLENTLRAAYSQLFDEMGDEAWNADRAALVHWFRASDKTSALVGQRQASTFQTLAALAGHGELPVARNATAKKATSTSNGKSKAARKETTQTPKATAPSAGENGTGGGTPATGTSPGKVENGHDVGLTVRIEVNLPSGGDASTYDAIFSSIKKHLMS